MSIDKKTFTSADLNGSYQLLYTHNLGTSDLLARWYDENGIERSTFDLFQVVDDNSIILSCGEAISGTHKLLLSYESVGSSSVGRRLFEQTETSNPSTSMKLAIGKAATQSLNITLNDFLVYIYNAIAVLKTANNLNDVANAATALSNLGAYSQTQVDALLALKATLLQAASGYALGTANTTVFNPTSDYHPATKKYVDDLTGIVVRGTYAVGDVSSGVDSRTVSLGTTLATDQYMIVGNMQDLDTGTTYVQDVIWGTSDHGTTSFKLQMKETASHTQNLQFNFMVVLL